MFYRPPSSCNVNQWPSRPTVLKSPYVGRRQRAYELAAEGERPGSAIWLRITDAIVQLASTTPRERVH
jgi:hypothetical protein